MSSFILNITLLILCFISLISTSSLVDLHKRVDQCGNGIVEAGEECDYASPDSKECCSRACKKLPSVFTSCNGGRGVCDGGTCKTRATQCSAFNQKVLSVDAKLALEGPFTPCDPDNGGRKEENVGCTISCAGNSVINGSSVCLDLGKYSNINNEMPDGSTCLVDSKPGVCLSGSCNPDKCRRVRCNNRGNCVVSGGNTVKCYCDSDYSGDDCSLTPSCDGKIDSCGVCNGDHTSCSIYDAQSFLQSRMFRFIILPVICGTIALIIIIVVIVVVMKKKKEKPKSSFTVLNQSQATIPQSPVAKQQAQMGISVKFDEFKCIHAYDPVMPDELELRLGDVLFKLFEYDDGWAKGYNTRTGKEGVYPVGFTERVVGN